MARGLVYRRSSSAAADAGGGDPADGYREKLIKYVPAEVVAGYIPLTLFIGADEDGWIVAAFIAGLIATLGYYYKQNQEIPEAQQAPPAAYLLVAVSFVAWALGTSALTADVIDLSAKAGGIILAIAAFVIPAVDFFGIAGGNQD